ncbi:Stress-responsive transcriptional regulator [Streptococcus sp. DD10]|uniref:PspC domain-containing protein n=1 Tax=Streptococcus sp. DD10 TaxID=1777878 RepID=UPI0007968CEB|nr:PspC domain-containing protein [Streptococcus sp. DD10]KXT75142.1 Stress-responsive transcriptional regulator [Streptococcus sp. DD10]
MSKKLTRDRNNKVIAGVCSGLARYFDIDPVIIRVLWGVAFFAYGLGFIPYLIFWVIVPED